MTNREFVLENLNNKKYKAQGADEYLFTHEERTYIKKALESWDLSDKEMDKKEVKSFLTNSIMELIKESSMDKKKKNKETKKGFRKIELVEVCFLGNDTKSSRVTIYNTDKNSLEEAVKDYEDNFNEDRVKEVIENFENICLKSKVTTASWV